MMKLIHVRTVFVLAISLIALQDAIPQSSQNTANKLEPPAKKATQVKITQGPSLELFKNNEAIIRWTSNNPGGSDEHRAIVQYGTHPKELIQTAKSHVRLNREHPYTVFRVRVPDLKPGTTYYYRVDSTDADGTSDKVKSSVYHFVAPKSYRLVAVRSFL